MSQAIPSAAGLPGESDVARGVTLRALMLLALPVLMEQVLHMVVGLTDTYLANHLQGRVAEAAAAVGTVAYFMWFIGLIAGAIGSGATAIIARAVGAKHRRLANGVCGQAVAVSVLTGAVLGGALYVAAPYLIPLTQLAPEAQAYALSYARLVSLSMPLTMLMFSGNACLRGAGDTLTPAITMVTVDAVNAVISFALVRGWGPLPELGFTGIAVGTVIAYVVGGAMQAVVLLTGRGGIRLYAHRLRPHWHTLKRLLRIGIPSAMESLLTWSAQFGVVIMINKLGSLSSAAHLNAIRIESASYLVGFAFSTAAATMVGQSLGAKDPRRAARSAYLAYAVGGGWMVLVGLFFIFFGWIPADWMTSEPAIREQTAMCLYITGFCQAGFAAAMIFGGALRGAGDTFSVMLLNLISVLGLRFVGAYAATQWLGMGLSAVWVVLAVELFVRGCLIYGRFLHGGWRHVEV